MHLCTIDHSPFGLAHTAIGSITDLHAERRSPIWKSTWQLQRHFGQWFLCSVPQTVFNTSSLHLAQLNGSPIELPCEFWDNCWFLRMKEGQTSQRNQSTAVLLFSYHVREAAIPFCERASKSLSFRYPTSADMPPPFLLIHSVIWHKGYLSIACTRSSDCKKAFRKSLGNLKI